MIDETKLRAMIKGEVARATRVAIRQKVNPRIDELERRVGAVEGMTSKLMEMVLEMNQRLAKMHSDQAEGFALISKQIATHDAFIRRRQAVEQWVVRAAGAGVVAAARRWVTAVMVFVFVLGLTALFYATMR